MCSDLYVNLGCSSIYFGSKYCHRRASGAAPCKQEKHEVGGDLPNSRLPPRMGQLPVFDYINDILYYSLYQLIFLVFRIVPHHVFVPLLTRNRGGISSEVNKNENAGVVYITSGASTQKETPHTYTSQIIHILSFCPYPNLQMLLSTCLRHGPAPG